MNSDLKAFQDTLFNVEKNNPLEKYVGKKCFLKFEGNDPKWGIQQDNETVCRNLGESVVVDDIIEAKPGNAARVFEIKAVQKAWGYNENNEYVPNTLALRIIAEDDEHEFGQVAHLEDIVLIN